MRTTSWTTKAGLSPDEGSAFARCRVLRSCAGTRLIEPLRLQPATDLLIHPRENLMHQQDDARATPTVYRIQQLAPPA